MKTLLIMSILTLCFGQSSHSQSLVKFLDEDASQALIEKLLPNKNFYKIRCDQTRCSLSTSKEAILTCSATYGIIETSHCNWKNSNPNLHSLILIQDRHFVVTILEASSKSFGDTDLQTRQTQLLSLNCSFKLNDDDVSDAKCKAEFLK